MLIYICDDEEKILSDMVCKVKTYLPDCSINAFSNPNDLLSIIKEKSCDILLLDIDMPQISGLELAKELSSIQVKPLLIFVTSHDELVYDSLQYHPFGFVRKSYFDIEIEKILNDCVLELSKKESYFYFKFGNEHTKILLSEILYFEAEGNYLRLYTKSQEYRFRETITAVENTLNSNGFIRVHKGFLINQAAVTLLRTDELELYNGTIIPIGRAYAPNAKNRIMRFIIA